MGARDRRIWKFHTFCAAGMVQAKRALTDWGLATVLFKSGGTPCHLPAAFWKQLPLKNLLAIAELCFTKIHTHPTSLRNYRYTTDPHNEHYSAHTSWVMPVNESFPYSFNLRNGGPKFATDLTGLYTLLEKYLKCLPVPWLRPLWRASTAAQYKLLTSKDFDLVYRHSGPFTIWLLYKLNNTFYGYSLKQVPHSRKQWIKTELPSVRHAAFLSQLRKVKRDFGLVFTVHSTDPYTDTPAWTLADVLYWGQDYSRHRWSARKKLLPAIAESIGLRPATECPKEGAPGQTLVFRHCDQKPYIYSHGAALSPGTRWYTFLLLHFENQGETCRLQLGLWEGSEGVPFTPKISVPSRVVKDASRPIWRDVARVAVLADTLAPHTPLRIYRVQPSTSDRQTEQITFKTLMET